MGAHKLEDIQNRKSKKMYSDEDLQKDLDILNIKQSDEITIKFITSKYKKMAKIKHPDREGGETSDFQDLQDAYKRLVKHFEGKVESDEEINYEKEFFMRNNVMKECKSSFVVYVQDALADNWRKIFQKHLKTHKAEGNSHFIFKTASITITLYITPKRDPRSKIHIQGIDQKMNLEFILEKLSLFYQ